jgi:hypothetical protein
MTNALVAKTLESIPIEHLEPTPRQKQHFCADKGDDYPDIRALVRDRSHTAPIKARGEEIAEGKAIRRVADVVVGLMNVRMRGFTGFGGYGSVGRGKRKPTCLC